MHKILFLLFFITRIAAMPASAQDTIPGVKVKNLRGKIIVSWLNDMTRTPVTVNVQRSYDSLKNYVTIGSVLNPENRENGFADGKPPYNNMYYRIFMAFDGGTYLFSKAAKPGNELLFTNSLTTGDSIALFHIKPITYNSYRVHPGRDNNIIPCGIENKQVTSIEKELGHAVEYDSVKEKIKRNFEIVFDSVLV